MLYNLNSLPITRIEDNISDIAHQSGLPYRWLDYDLYWHALSNQLFALSAEFVCVSHANKTITSESVGSSCLRVSLALAAIIDGAICLECMSIT